MRAIFIVFRKEFSENLRDRRTVFSALIFGPLFGPLLLAGMLQLMLTRGDATRDQPVSLAVAHAERAPNLLSWLVQNHITLSTVNADDRAAREAVRSRKFSVVLDIPADYGARLANGEPAPLLLYVDESDAVADRSVRRVKAALNQYGAGIGQLRLLARGVDPAIANPVAVQSIDVSTPRTRGVLALSMLSYLIIFATLMGGLYIAIDSTAGERERGSLESLLTMPVPREQLIYGKILAAACCMLLSLSLTVTACAAVLPLIRLEDYGMTANLGPLTALSVVLIVAPLVLAGAALLTVVASFTRSYREAQTWLSVVLLIPTLPLAFMSLLALQPSTVLMAVPSLSQHFLMTRLLRDEPLPWLDVGVSVSATLLLGLALTWIAGRLYRREAILG
jgi:sodium transport system permease protein